ncbi:MAG: signal peptidase I [Verrucomicrobiota bacterium]
MNLRSIFSGKAREAAEACKRVDKLLNSQRDILSPQAIAAVESAKQDVRKNISDSADKETLAKSLKNLGIAANKNLKPYPNAKFRENVEVFLVAIAVAMAIRTFFLQPFKIPTGSMQPTLYGMEIEPLPSADGQGAGTIPRLLTRVWNAAVHGEFYHYLKAQEDGQLVKVDPPKHVLIFLNKQTFWVKYNGQDRLTPLTLWFAPDQEQAPGQENKFFRVAGLQTEMPFQKGQNIFQVKETAGDHLFVDRMIHNFRMPERGEIIVFKTKGIKHPLIKEDQFFIKRLVALGGEKVSLGDDQHLRIDGKRLDSSTPHFQNVYNFAPVWQENHYFGHANDTVARQYLPLDISPYFPNAETEYVVPPKHYLVMGDNTLRSFDSRGWGPFPRDNVIGKSFFVYWPISNHSESRFGWKRK